MSSQPGKTQLVNFFLVGNEMYLADLPGYGYARVPEAMRLDWDRLAASYLVGRQVLSLCVFLVDARHEPSDGDETLRDFLDESGVPYVVAANKIDKLGRGQVKARIAALERGLAQCARGVLGVSAETGEGIEQLWRTVREAAAEHRREG